MKYLALVALFFASPVMGQARPAFDFRGFVAGEIATAEQLAGCDAKGDINICDGTGETLAGFPAATRVTLYRGMLHKVTSTVGRSGFPTVRAAFVERYGQPCRSETTLWQNATGAELANEITAWCFASGELEIVQISDQLRYMTVTYLDNNGPPVTRAVPDF